MSWRVARYRRLTFAHTDDKFRSCPHNPQMISPLKYIRSLINLGLTIYQRKQNCYQCCSTTTTITTTVTVLLGFACHSHTHAYRLAGIILFDWLSIHELICLLFVDRKSVIAYQRVKRFYFRCKKNVTQNLFSIYKHKAILFLLNCSTNTMIDIITTRFHEAYTWINPPEHERRSEIIKRDQHITMAKRFNVDHQKRIAPVDVKGTQVITISCFLLYDFLNTFSVPLFGLQHSWISDLRTCRCGQFYRGRKVPVFIALFNS